MRFDGELDGPLSTETEVRRSTLIILTDVHLSAGDFLPKNRHGPLSDTGLKSKHKSQNTKKTVPTYFS